MIPASPLNIAARGNGRQVMAPRLVKLVQEEVPEEIAKTLKLFEKKDWGKANLLFCNHHESEQLFRITRSLDIAMSHLSSMWTRSSEEIVDAAECMTEIRKLVNQLDGLRKRLAVLTGTDPKVQQRRKWTNASPTGPGVARPEAASKNKERSSAKAPDKSAQATPPAAAKESSSTDEDTIVLPSTKSETEGKEDAAPSEF